VGMLAGRSFPLMPPDCPDPLASVCVFLALRFDTVPAHRMTDYYYSRQMRRMR